MAILQTDIQILFTNYDIIAYFLNLASCSEHFKLSWLYVLKNGVGRYNTFKKKNLHTKSSYLLSFACIDGLSIFLLVPYMCFSPLSGPFAESGFVFIDYIKYFILTKYHYIILTDYPRSTQTLYRIGSLCRSQNIWILYGSTLNSLMDTRKSKSDVFHSF
jgi:hypothetical protein